MFDADADVVHAAGDAQAELAVFVDDVVQDPVADVAAAVSVWGGFGAGGVGGGRGRSVWELSVGPAVIALVEEAVDESLLLRDGGGLDALPDQPFLHGLLEPLYLSGGGRVVGPGVLLDDVEASQFGLQAVASAPAA